ncbi:MAG: ECF-type sigma factor [Planctomycetota bacterium]
MKFRIPLPVGPMETDDSLSVLLAGAKQGQTEARNALAERLYSQLKQLARAHMRDQPSDVSIQSTGLVHEAWMRVFGGGEIRAEDRGQFFKLASTAMRSVLVDRARARHAAKRGGGWSRAELEEQQISGGNDNDQELLQLNELLEVIGREDRKSAEIAEMRIFGGLSCAEVAEIKGVSKRTVERQWAALSRTLKRELGRGGSPA